MGNKIALKLVLVFCVSGLHYVSSAQPGSTFDELAGKDTVVCVPETPVTLGNETAPDDWCYTWEPDDGTLDDIKARNPVATPTETTIYYLTVTGNNFEIHIKDKVEVTVAEYESAEFIDADGSRYGFDDVTNLPGNPGDGSSIPWKSVRKADVDMVRIDIKPDPYKGGIFIKNNHEGMVKISLTKVRNNLEFVNVDALSVGTAEIDAKCGGPESSNLFGSGVG